MEQLPIFVYGTLKKGHGNSHAWGCEAKEIHEGKLQKALMFNVGFFPAVVRSETLGATSMVKGEIWYLNQEDYNQAIKNLDRLEGYHEGSPDSSMYLRKKVRVWDGQLKKFIDCWTYIWNRSIDGMPRVVTNRGRFAAIDIGEWQLVS